MKFLIIGCGSIGLRHLRNLKSLGHEVIGFEPNPQIRLEVRQQYNIDIYDDIKIALNKEIDAALICSPTSTHIKNAQLVAKRGKHIFIEKPISNDLEGIEKLKNLIYANKLMCFNACNIRFLKSLKLVKKLIESGRIGKVLSVRVECGFYLPYWHPTEDYRLSYSARKSLGGGVIFDDIHELDSLLWLFGDVSEVFCMMDKISEIEIETEDLAEIFIKFVNGPMAQIHLDYIQRTYRRVYEFIGENGTIVLDINKQKIELFDEDTNHSEIFQESINYNREQMFIDEIKYFINCIKDGREPMNNISDATETLKIALACHESARSKKVVFIENENILVTGEN